MNQADKMLATGYLPASQAAKQIGISVQTLYRWMDQPDRHGFQLEGSVVAGHRYVKIASLVQKLGGPTKAAALGILVPSSVAPGESPS